MERQGVRWRHWDMTKRIAALGLALLLAACGSDAGDGPAGPAGEWRLTDGTHDGAPLQVPANAPITMIVADGEIGGTAACNRYGGEVSIDGDRLAVGAMSMTEMGCDQAVMDAESAYLAALGAVTGWERSGDQLMLTGESVELSYALVPPEADAGLQDTLWTLDSLVDGDAVSSTMGGQPATLELRGDGTLSGSTGCREFTGSYELDGSVVTVTELINEDLGCPDLAMQDEHVLCVLVDAFSYQIEGASLTLTSGDRGLGYRAAAE
jgi:heat shock protein HslJ